MFCLRSWLPLLFIPTNASPSFILLFFLCTYFLNRPCFYCSFLLLILFLTSCNWSDRCFLDLSGPWFESSPSHPAGKQGGHNDAPGATENNLNATASAVAIEMLNTTAGALATAAKRHLAQTTSEWTGLGLEWLRSLLGRREWRIDCLDVNIRL
ncbi:hypothetical protein VTJ83DRAFT_6199 [Remersonia thermophila]|uniref:Bladder cancer-related BC10-like protein n=1 Tax=Remersonia thermophila TaxID=72144 RepID=A0ABR4D507_9PEZI